MRCPLSAELERTLSLLSQRVQIRNHIRPCAYVRRFPRWWRVARLLLSVVLYRYPALSLRVAWQHASVMQMIQRRLTMRSDR